MTQLTPISEALTSFSHISLDEMDNVRLMNRTDTKYVVSVNRLPGLLAKMNGDYRILEINGNRVFSYLTTYLDTGDYLFFNHHITGKLSRNKVRFRRYEATGITFLEVKKRTNKNRTVKWRIENNLPSDGIFDAAACEFINRHVPQRPLVLQPVLTNTFRRITFVGAEVKERITLDYNISFTNPEGRNAALQKIAVVEVKKDMFTDRSFITAILKESAVYPTGFSKYCIGSAVLNEHLRKNILKPKLLMINKLEYEYDRLVLA
ncbi:MAG: hypothetical protein A2V64_11655 [Bacteroidetes bacterium RBG_13_43_22]|nr:MAG: hypothetical protein A2V64_11655 [Bacteroidetes bacterium RBG_13_43_22]